MKAMVAGKKQHSETERKENVAQLSEEQKISLAKEKVNMATELWYKKSATPEELNTALQYLDEAFKLVPNREDGWHFERLIKASIYAQLGKLDAAIEECDKAIQTGIGVDKAYEHKVNIFLFFGKKEEAKKTIEEYMEMRNKFFELAKKDGFTWHHSTYMDVSMVEKYNEITENKKESHALITLAIDLQTLPCGYGVNPEDFAQDKFSENYRKALVFALKKLDIVYLKKVKEDELEVRYFDRVTRKNEIQKLSPSELVEIVRTGKRLVRPAAAEDRIALNENVQKSISIIEEVYENLQTMEPNEAFKKCEEALRLNPSLYTVNLFAGTMAKISQRNKQYEEALEWAQMAIEKVPAYIDAWRTKISVLAELGRNNEAIEACDEMLKHDPYAYEFHWRAARILLKEGKKDEAAKRLVSALYISQNDTRVFDELANLGLDKVFDAHGLKVPEPILKKIEELQLVGYGGDKIKEALHPYVEILGDYANNINKKDAFTSIRQLAPLDGLIAKNLLSSEEVRKEFEEALAKNLSQQILGDPSRAKALVDQFLKTGNWIVKKEAEDPITCENKWVIDEAASTAFLSALFQDAKIWKTGKKDSNGKDILGTLKEIIDEQYFRRKEEEGKVVFNVFSADSWDCEVAEEQYKSDKMKNPFIKNLSFGEYLELSKKRVTLMNASPQYMQDDLDMGVSRKYKIYGRVDVNGNAEAYLTTGNTILSLIHEYTHIVQGRLYEEVPVDTEKITSLPALATREGMADDAVRSVVDFLSEQYKNSGFELLRHHYDTEHFYSGPEYHLGSAIITAMRSIKGDERFANEDIPKLIDAGFGKTELNKVIVSSLS